jgi:hypothetical protein
MRLNFNAITFVAAIAASVCLSSCYTEDPGPIQQYEKQFSEVDFDRLEMGDAFNITVTRSNLFEITASGDRRNVEDLIVKKEGSTLVVRFAENRNRKHDTKIDIKMPLLASANFSGASDSNISGFEDLERLDIDLSGASVCQLDVTVGHVNTRVSGASYLYMYGEGEEIVADLSGASVLKAFHYPVSQVDIKASGASDGHVNVKDKLDVVASGASVVTYRGEPVVTSDVSGASSVHQD